MAAAAITPVISDSKDDRRQSMKMRSSDLQELGVKQGAEESGGYLPNRREEHLEEDS